MIGLLNESLQSFFDEEEDEVFDPAGVAPLVVVPANDLASIGDDLGQLGVEDAGHHRHSRPRRLHR